MQVKSLSIIHYSYETLWSESNYKGGSQEFLVVDLRNFRDPYIRASSITQGCTTLHTQATTCFPTDSQSDIATLELASQILFVAFIVTIIEVLVSAFASSHPPGGPGLLPLPADPPPEAEEAQRDPPGFDCL